MYIFVAFRSCGGGGKCYFPNRPPGSASVSSHEFTFVLLFNHKLREMDTNWL